MSNKKSTEGPTWLEYCPVCKRKHYVTPQPCPSCGVYFTPQPKSETVLENCGRNYECDGCHAYREHMY